MPTERGRSMQVDRAAKQCGELVLLAKEHQTRVVPRQVFHEQIDIAGRSEVLPQRRAKHSKPSHAVFPTEARDFLRINRDRQIGQSHTGSMAGNSMGSSRLSGSGQARGIPAKAQTPTPRSSESRSKRKITSKNSD